MTDTTTNTDAPKHSPGPWKVRPGKKTPAHIEPANSTVSLATVFLSDPVTRKRTAECAANLSLILAAPDMLSALRFALDRLEVCADYTVDEQDRWAVETARAAIAKAEGRAP